MSPCLRSLNNGSTASQALCGTSMNYRVLSYIWNSSSNLKKLDSGLLWMSCDWPKKGQPHSWSESSGVVGVCRKRWDENSSSKCCLCYQQPYIQPELPCERRSAAIPLGSENRLFKYLWWACRPYIFAAVMLFLRSGSKETFQLLMWEGAFDNQTEKTRFFFRRCLIHKVQLFCHTFLSVSQGWKDSGSSNCGACKRHGFQPIVSDGPDETDPWCLQAGPAPFTTGQQDWLTLQKTKPKMF